MAFGLFWLVFTTGWLALDIKSSQQAPWLNTSDWEGLSVPWKINPLHLVKEGALDHDGVRFFCTLTVTSFAAVKLLCWQHWRVGLLSFAGMRTCQRISPRYLRFLLAVAHPKKNVQNLEAISACWYSASLWASLSLSLCSRGDDVRFYHVPMIFPIWGSRAVVMTKGLFNWSWGQWTSKGGNFWTTFFLFCEAKNLGVVFVLCSTLDVTHSHPELRLLLSEPHSQRDPSVVGISELVHDPPTYYSPYPVDTNGSNVLKLGNRIIKLFDLTCRCAGNSVTSRVMSTHVQLTFVWHLDDAEGASRRWMLVFHSSPLWHGQSSYHVLGLLVSHTSCLHILGLSPIRCTRCDFFTFPHSDGKGFVR